MNQVIYQSTKALSVYNMLSLSGRDMTRDECAAALRGAMSLSGVPGSGDEFDRAYVDDGAAYLLERGFISQAIDGRLAIPMRDAKTRRGPPLKRINFDKDIARAS